MTKFYDPSPFVGKMSNFIYFMLLTILGCRYLLIQLLALYSCYFYPLSIDPGSFSRMSQNQNGSFNFIKSCSHSTRMMPASQYFIFFMLVMKTEIIFQSKQKFKDHEQQFFELINQMKNIYQFFKQPMRKFIHSFRMNFCTFKLPSKIQPQILLNNFPETNILVTDVHEGDLNGVISDLLKKPYLGICQKSHEEIQAQRKFFGASYGDGFRMFITMPTRPNIHLPYLYVHYLLDSGSPFTTLTHQALCALHGKKYSINTTFNPSNYSIGPSNIEVHLSNPRPGIQDTIYHNVNVLGRNFYRQFKKVQIFENIQKENFEMIVQKQK